MDHLLGEHASVIVLDLFCGHEDAAGREACRRRLVVSMSSMYKLYGSVRDGSELSTILFSMFLLRARYPLEIARVVRIMVESWMYSTRKPLGNLQ